MELASQKARDVYEHYGDADCVVIGADTIVAYNGEILGKPATQSEAYDMLAMLADRTHQVYTGVSLIMAKRRPGPYRTFFEATDVTFYPISKGGPAFLCRDRGFLTKAGDLRYQGPFAIHVKCIRGDYNNVVGLPVSRLYQELLREYVISFVTSIIVVFGRALPSFEEICRRRSVSYLCGGLISSILCITSLALA